MDTLKKTRRESSPLTKENPLTNLLYSRAITKGARGSYSGVPNECNGCGAVSM